MALGVNEKKHRGTIDADFLQACNVHLQRLSLSNSYLKLLHRAEMNVFRHLLNYPASRHVGPKPQSRDHVRNVCSCLYLHRISRILFRISLSSRSYFPLPISQRTNANLTHRSFIQLPLVSGQCSTCRSTTLPTGWKSEPC